MTKSKLKILHIIPTLKTGGAERLLLDIMERIDQTKFTPVVLVFKEAGELYQKLTALPIQVFLLEKKGKLDFKNLWQMYQILKKEKPDIVHTHLGGDIYGRLLAGLLGITVVSTEHNLNKDEKGLVSVAKRLTAPFATCIIAVSKAVKKDIEKRYGINPSKVKVIYNGIDINHFKPASASEKNKTSFSASDQIKIGAAGRLVEQKGFIYLIEAISEVKKEYPEVVCEIVGEGSLRKSLEEMIKKNNLEKNVLLPGVYSEMSSFYKKLDLFIMPSLWEGLGIAVLEAAAANVPVIASRVDGLEEIIENETEGLLASPGDAEGLARNIIEAINNYQSSLERSEVLAKKVRTLFSIEQMVTNYQQVYEDIASK